MRCFKFFCGAVIFFSFFFIAYHRIDPDFWWHIKVGEWVFANNGAPLFDIYSYTMPGYPWIDHEWLTNAFFYILYANNLGWLLTIIFSLIASIPFFVWLKRAHSLFSLWAILLGASFIALFMGVRPQFVSFLLFFLLFEILHKHFTRAKPLISNHKPFWGFYLLPLLFLLWANLHAGFASGLFIFAAWLFTHYVIQWNKKGNEKKVYLQNLKADILVFLGCLLAPLINPYGVRLYQEIISVLFSYETGRYIAEWQSGLNVFNPAIILFLALLVVAAFKFRKIFHREHFILAILFFFLFLKSVRHGPLFLLLALPLLSEALQGAHEEIKKTHSRIPQPPYHKKVAVVISVALFLVPFYFLFDTAYGAENSPQFAPARAIQFLKTESKKQNLGNIFNDYGWGGYIIFAAPEFKVFIDGRMPHWTLPDGTSAMKEFALAGGLNQEDKNFNKNAWKEIFKKHNVRTALLPFVPRAETKKEDALTELVKPWLLRYPQIAHFLAKLLGLTPPFYLEEALVQTGWKRIYTDSEAQILYCETSCE